MERNLNIRISETEREDLQMIAGTAQRTKSDCVRWLIRLMAKKIRAKRAQNKKVKRA